MTTQRSRAATLLLPRYLEHRERDVVELRRALDIADFASISRMGHNFRGNGRSYGFPEVAAMGEALEVAARARSVAGVQEQLEALEAWLTNREPAVLAEVAPLLPASATRVRAVPQQMVSTDPEGKDEG
jgi:HPt (histidine-containing phosphotransfer) domain-containing protein